MLVSTAMTTGAGPSLDAVARLLDAFRALANPGLPDPERSPGLEQPFGA